MANIKSQIKRNRQNDKRRLRNRVFRGTARIAVKTTRTAIEDGAPESKAALTNAIRALDKAAEQGVIHKNNAARRKSRLVKAFNKMEPAVAEPAMLEPVAEPEPKKAAPRGRAAKAEAAVEPKADTKKKAAKKAPAKKTSTTAKKPAAKK